MVVEKDLWKHRSWELTVEELMLKQKKCRKNMWFVFIVWFAFFVAGVMFQIAGLYYEGVLSTIICVMLLIVMFIWKYFEMNFSTIIEIRRIKNE